MLAIVLQAIAISLGMGSSTLAICNFFVAIADGTIDAGERKMMGVVYKVLRVAMVVILITTLFLLFMSINAISEYMIAQVIIVTVLFVNSFLMTKRIMPSSIGPALQAGSWYTLGMISTLVSAIGITFDLGMFILWYCAAIVVALVLVNGFMSYQKKHRVQ